jgi:carboxymethylenebutenolidase
MPATGSNFPVVLVVQEIFGLHEHIRDLCRRLAKEGYFAISAELYARQGDVSKLANIQEIFAIVREVPDAQVLSDLDAQVAFAKASGKADGNRVAITGFCWGGRIVWLYAAHNPSLKAGAAWYGRLAGDASPLQPKNPVDVAGQLHAPVLGLYGADDTGIPLDTVEKMRDAVQKAGKTAEIIVYPNTPHAFNADYRPSYREKEAKDAWAKMLAWFRKYGV